MYRTYFVAIIFLCSFTVSMASPSDSILTYYKNGEFITYSQVWVDVPNEIMNGVVDDFLYQTKYDLDAMFGWALKDMKLRKEKDEIIVFNFKSTEYDEKNDVIKNVGDVEIPNLINFPDIHVDDRMTKTVLADGRTKVNIDVLYSDNFLKKTTGVFYVNPKRTDGCWITLEIKVKFGRFFDFFITKFTYRYIMEWRFQKLMHNIALEAERRKSLIGK